MFERVMTHGAGLLLCLSLPFFAVAAVQFAVWLLQLVAGPPSGLLLRVIVMIPGGTWLYSLSTGGFFLAAAVIVDRLDRWLPQTKRQS